MLHNLLYYAQKDIFIDMDTGSMYSHEDLDFFMTMEILHKEEIKEPSLYQLMEMFPTGKQAAIRGVKARIKAVKEKLDGIGEMRERKVKLLDNINMLDRPLYMKDIEDSLSKYLTDGEKELKRYNFQLSYLNRLGEKEKEVKSGSLTVEDIAAARHIPITNFIKVRRDRKANCLFHSDKNASMHVYGDNHFYCFSCNESGDVIDIIKKMYGYSFREAVEFLIGKRV